MADVDKFKDKQEELETMFNPIIKKLYGKIQQSGPESCGAQIRQRFGAQTNICPTAEEVD